jgi:sterol desaturase/sphingolipid hydroxylase (fatty acid hydroxylase superfamily)
MLEQYRIGILKGFELQVDKKDANASADVRDLCDFRKPVVPQVLRMGPEYMRWVHYTAGPKGFRIFETDFFEAFSHYPWWYIYFMVRTFPPLPPFVAAGPGRGLKREQWVPVIIYTMYLSLAAGTGVLQAALLFPVGMLVWTILEYVLHRFVFHMRASGGLSNFIHFMAHGIHHLTPTDASRLAFPPPFAVVLGYSLYCAIVGTFGAGGPQAVFSGGAFMYLMYDTLHFFFHHGDIRLPGPLDAYFRYMKSRHLDHHFKTPDRRFGVTCPLWDFVFGTD